MRSDHQFLTDIVASADTIASKIKAYALGDFLTDDDLQRVVLLELIFIGEAAARLAPTVRQRYPEVSWVDAIAFRNRVVHGYFSIDWTIVWGTATIAVPILRSQVAEIVARDYPPGLDVQEGQP